jgi:hypothetical protein
MDFMTAVQSFLRQALVSIKQKPRNISCQFCLGDLADETTAATTTTATTIMKCCAKNAPVQ